MGFLQFGLLFAAVSGVLGAVWASLQERGRPVQAVLEAFISAIAAAARRSGSCRWIRRGRARRRGCSRG